MDDAQSDAYTVSGEDWSTCCSKNWPLRRLLSQNRLSAVATLSASPAARLLSQSEPEIYTRM